MNKVTTAIVNIYTLAGKGISYSIIMALYLLTATLFAQSATQNETSKARILVIGLHPTQFYSNVYFIDELATLNDTSQAKAVELYNATLVQSFVNYTSDQYQFIAPDSAETARVHAKSTFVDWKNEYKEPYVAIDSDTVQDAYMQSLMDKYGATYLLSLNYYLIYRNNPPAYYMPIIKAKHQLHYELFSREMGIVSAGQMVIASNNARADYMKGKYPEFSQLLLDRLAIVEANYTPAVAEKKYLLLRERLVKNKWGGGFSVGWGMPYSWFGTELVRNLGNRWDVNAGVGFGPSGFKAGAGIRYYLLNYGTRFKPFLSATYAWGSGMKLTMGGEKDESGALIDEEAVTEFRIPSGHAVHLKTGFRWLKLNRAFMVGVGYGIPFTENKAEVLANGSNVSAEAFSRRKKWADLFNIGGLDVGITYIIYFL